MRSECDAVEAPPQGEHEVPVVDADQVAEAVAVKVVELLGSVREQRFLSVADAATYTGLSPDSIRSLLAGGKLTALRPVGGRIVIDKREIDSYVLSATRRPPRGRGRCRRDVVEVEG